jgi:hypothetical protein
VVVQGEDKIMNEITFFSSYMGRRRLDIGFNINNSDARLFVRSYGIMNNQRVYTHKFFLDRHDVKHLIRISRRFLEYYDRDDEPENYEVLP